MIEVKIDATLVVGAMERLARFTANAAPVMKTIAGIMHDAVEENFSQGGRPKWLGLKAPSKKRHGGQVLVDSARLKNSITTQSDSSSATVGTNVKYAAIHQFGGDVKHKARSGTAYFRQGKDGSVGNRFVKKGLSNFSQAYTAGAHTTNMPARPFLLLTQGDEEKIVRTVSEYLRNSVK